MSRTLPQGTKANLGSFPGTIRADERPRNSLTRSPIPIAPRPSVYDSVQPGEIRLVDIFPSEDRSTPIRAALRRQPLRYAIYEALSLACRSEELPAIVEVNGQPFSISSSLLEALRALRTEKNNRTLWVDSICVNQNDVEERGEQAGLENKALEHATAVIAWPWGKSANKDALDDRVPAQWLIPSRTLSPAWSSAISQVGGLEIEHSFDFRDCHTYIESPPALTSSPKSPQPTSASSSPGLKTDPQFQDMCLEVMQYPIGCDSPFMGSADDADLLQQQLPADKTMGNMFNPSERKRSLVTAFPDELVHPCHRKVQQIQPISATHSEGAANIVFACPFHRFNPQKYHRCLKYTLNRIKDVKQHIYRQHSRPSLYCARCYQVFTTIGDRDVHSRRADCDTRSPPEFEGITDQQRNELKKSSPKKKPLDEQWFELWEVVFPGRRRPQSPFIGNHVEEIVPLLREIWNEKKAAIISGVIETRGRPTAVDDNFIADIMGSVFDSFEAETARSSHGSNTERSETQIQQLQDTTNLDSGFGGAESCFEFAVPIQEQGIPQIDLLDFNLGCTVDNEDYYSLPHAPTPLQADLAG